MAVIYYLKLYTADMNIISKYIQLMDS